MAAKFLKKILAVEDVNPDAVYPDLPDNDKIAMDVMGGSRDAFIITNYTVPDAPPFGDAELIGGYIGHYLESVTLGPHISFAPSISVYKMEDNFSLTTANVGGSGNNVTSVFTNDIIAMSANFNFVSIKETFANIDKNTESSSRFPTEAELTTIAGQTIIQTGPYLEPSFAHSKGELFGEEASLPGATVSLDTYKNWFGKELESGETIIPIEKAPSGAWGNKWRTKKKKKKRFRRDYDQFNLGVRPTQFVKYDSFHSVEGLNAGSSQINVQPKIGPENTIFTDKLAAETFYEAGDDGALRKIAYSDVFVCTDNVYTSGASARFEAIWPSKENTNTAINYNSSAAGCGLHLQESRLIFDSMPMPPVLSYLAGDNYCATVEMVVNFEEIALCLTRENLQATASYSSDNMEDGLYRMNRGFHITFSNLKPTETQTFYEFTQGRRSGVEGFWDFHFVSIGGKLIVFTGEELDNDAVNYEQVVKNAHEPTSTDLGNAADLFGRWLKLIFTFPPNRTTGDKDKIQLAIVDPETNVRLYTCHSTSSSSPAVGATVDADTIIECENQGSRALTSFSTFDTLAMPKVLTFWSTNFPSIFSRFQSEDFLYRNGDSTKQLRHFGAALANGIDDSTQTITIYDKTNRNMNKGILNYVAAGDRIQAGGGGTGAVENMFVTSVSSTQLNVNRNSTGGADGTGSAQAIGTDMFLVYGSDGHWESLGDARTSVVLDSIEFKNFNLSHENATALAENEASRERMLIPTRKEVLTDVLFTNGGGTGWDDDPFTFTTADIMVGAPSYLVFGFKNKTDIEDRIRFLWFNDFTASSLENIGTIHNGNIKVGYSFSASDATENSLGLQCTTAFFEPHVSTPADARGLTTTDGGEFDMTDINQVENFGQKGAVLLNDFEERTGYDFVSRECIFASARILQLIDDYSVLVDDPSLFNLPADEVYRIYTYGTNLLDANYDDLKVEKKDGAIITFTEKVPRVGGFVTTTCFISPVRFWLVVMIDNRDAAAAGNLLTERTYGSVNLLKSLETDADIADNPNTANFNGITFAESKLTDAATYTNAHTLDPYISGGAFKNNVDYDGKGALDEEKNQDGGVVVRKSLNALSDVSQFHDLDISSAITLDGLKPGDSFNMAIVSGEPQADDKLVFTAVSASSNKPYFLGRFRDEVPQRPILTVEPFEGDNFYPHFKWESSDADTWYGFLIIDNNQIPSQYHNSIFHLPMNETGLHNVAVPASTIENTRFNYNSDTGVVASTTHITASGVVWHREGLAGNCVYFDGSNDYIVYNPSSAATATITITDYTELNPGDKVNLIATDGTNYDFTNGSQSSVAGTWESTTSNNATATNLMNVINTSSGPAGTRFTATVDGAEVTATQATTGADGNTTVTLTDGGTVGMTKANFTGGGDTLGDITSEASFIAHIIPDSSVAGATNYILYGDPIRLWLDATTGKINATVYWDYSDSARGITLTSGSIIPIDGETPTSIIVTLDKNLKHGNAKLFLNGRLEDQSGLCLASATAAAATNNWGSDDDVYIKHNPFYVGFTSNSFHGRIEEVVVYNKAIYPILPQQQEYVFKKPLQEIQGSAPVSYAARLFIKDYHNIRGTVPTQVASSSQISYAKAGFDLTG